jgi:hypothetical protein
MKYGLSRTAKIMCGALLALCVFFLMAGLSAISFLYPFEQPLAYSIGLVTGTLLSVAKVILMEKTLNRAADMGEFKSARNYGALQITLRNVLTLGFFLAVFFFREVFGLFGAIIGVLSLQAAAYITGFILRKDSAQV